METVPAAMVDGCGQAGGQPNDCDGQATKPPLQDSRTSLLQIPQRKSSDTASHYSVKDNQQICLIEVLSLPVSTNVFPGNVNSRDSI